MRIAVPFQMTVWCEVDTETGEIERVVTEDENLKMSETVACQEIGADGIYTHLTPNDGDTYPAEIAPIVERATEIAESDQDWPAWTRGF